MGSYVDQFLSLDSWVTMNSILIDNYKEEVNEGILIQIESIELQFVNLKKTIMKTNPFSVTVACKIPCHSTFAGRINSEVAATHYRGSKLLSKINKKNLVG